MGDDGDIAIGTSGGLIMISFSYFRQEGIVV